MSYTNLLSSADIQPVADGVYDVLERVGLLCQNSELICALENAGARVDVEEERAWFPKNLTQTFVDALRDECSNADTNSAAGSRVPASSPPSPPPLPTFGTQIAQACYDYPSGVKRPGNKTDFIELIKLADVLHPAIPAGHCLVDTTVPGKVEALEAALVIAEYAHKPGRAFAWFADQIDYLMEMGDVLGIPDWFDWGAICFAHPLRFDRDVADKFVRRAKSGVPTGLTAMPVAGCSTPVTVEGFIVVAAAEHVATWIGARALNPEVPLGGSMWAGSVDPGSGHVSYSSFDAMHRAFVTVDFLRQWTGMNISVGGGEYCDAREPGMSAVYEKAYKAMTIAAFTGEHPPAGEGLLECGRTLAPVQLILERDFIAGEGDLFGRNRIETDNIGMDVIEQIGLGITINHLMTEHTLEHFRDSLWLPDIIDRAGWDGAKSDVAMLDKAQSRIDEMVESYHKPAGREDMIEKMRSIVVRARNTLLK